MSLLSVALDLSVSTILIFSQLSTTKKEEVNENLEKTKTSSTTMIPTITRVSQITNQVPVLWDLRVFLLRVWMWCSSTDERKISMILCDEDGVRIEALVSGELCESFHYATWLEGRWFRLRDPTVEYNPVQGSLTPHTFKLMFHVQTGFFNIYDNLPVGNFMVYSTISDIIDGVVEERYPIDVIGVVTKVGRVQWGYAGHVIQFTIRNIELRGIQCLLFGKDAFKLLDIFRSDAERHIFVILCCFFVQRMAGYTWLKGVNGLSTIMYDQFDNPEWNDFRNSYPNPVPHHFPQEPDMSWFIF